MILDLDVYVAALAQHGEALAVAADAVDLAEPVPDCPGWTVRSVLEHTSMVHRWATRHLREGTAAPLEPDPPPVLPDDALRAHYRDGHQSLVAALEGAPDDLEAFRFLHEAPPARLFWARRQAHETAIHHSDVAVVAGGPPAYDSDFATDGIDELLVGFMARRRGRLVSPRSRTLGVRTTDTGRSWLLTIRAEARQVARGDFGDADCLISGPAPSVYPFLWNRTVITTPTVDGDAAVHALWRKRAGIG